MNAILYKITQTIILTARAPIHSKALYVLACVSIILELFTIYPHLYFLEHVHVHKSYLE